MKCGRELVVWSEELMGRKEEERSIRREKSVRKRTIRRT